MLESLCGASAYIHTFERISEKSFCDRYGSAYFRKTIRYGFVKSIKIRFAESHSPIWFFIWFCQRSRVSLFSNKFMSVVSPLIPTKPESVNGWVTMRELCVVVFISIIKNVCANSLYSAGRFVPSFFNSFRAAKKADRFFTSICLS